ncbi:MAG: DUF11 domain-containing protein [Acidobacteria bacterium]|nr:DUF11 domain-containing protein [Acidobacteriota bacterium]
MTSRRPRRFSDPVIAGTLLTYTVNVTNNGPSAALNLKITDPLPGGNGLLGYRQ